MDGTELLPYDGMASYASVNQYQRKIGSILFPAVNTRVDISFVVSRLARFNLNPSETHHKAANRVIHYLLGTMHHSLTLGGGDTLETYSDASFADNSLDRKSSQAYVLKLFGGVIGWRASKQDTVTTSTTEAELLSLAQAAKEALFVSRLVKELGVELDQEYIQVWCDNQQTIRLVNADVAVLQTKLRHVDIHNHWLRQCAARKQIKVDYKPTGSMLADGLTKALPQASFERFRAELGLEDLGTLFKERKHREITEDELAEMEDLLPGGEVTVEYETAPEDKPKEDGQGRD